MLSDHTSENKPPDDETPWRLLKVIDLMLSGDYPGTCDRDRCGRTDIRFLHVLQAGEQRIRVGSECARHLCHGYLPELEERRLKNLWARRKRR